MRLSRNLVAHTPDPIHRGSVVALGNFDGFHLGHQAIIQHVHSLSQPLGLASAVITFCPHPRDYFASLGKGKPVHHICSVRDRLALLNNAGVGEVFLFRFNHQLATLAPDVFVRHVLVERCKARHVVVGKDVHFGHQRAGDIHLLRQLGQQYNFKVHTLDDLASSGHARVSSSAVRHALQAANIQTANALLGRPYSLSGRVIHGRKLARTLGWPTLNVNIRLPLPAAQGIWVVSVKGLDAGEHTGVASIGLRPTVEHTTRYSLEVHVLDWGANAYGKRVDVRLLHKLRDEQVYTDIPSLGQAISQDIQAARSWLQTAHP